VDWTWLITAASIIGTVANIHRRRWCFGLWLVTNGAWTWIDLRAGLYSQAALMSVYVGLAIWGLVKWDRV